jgi:hypothetical protein
MQLETAPIGGERTSASVSVANPPAAAPTIVCGTDGTSFTAFGSVTPPPPESTVTAFIRDGNMNAVGSCTAISPVPGGLPGSPNWAFQCTGLTPGVTLSLVVSASIGGKGTQTTVIQFTCTKATPTPGPVI